MPTAVGELNRILRDFNAKYRASLSAVVSRSGVPIAWAMPPDTRVDNLATLSATILGASEVIYSGLNQDPPRRVIVEADKVTDQDSEKLSFEIAQKIQTEMTFPGQIKVTVIREKRTVNVAR